jgi:glycine/D-amino acid oxidase-like deaminating enzyme
MEADEGAVSEGEQEGQGGEEFVRVAEEVQAWWKDWTQARWEKLNEAFGEGWEKECFPYLETGTWGFQPGNQYTPGRDEAQWDAILEAVKEFKRTHQDRFPRGTGGDADETRLYRWLRNNLDTTSHLYTQERANKLVQALGDRWWRKCFPYSNSGICAPPMRPGTWRAWRRSAETRPLAKGLVWPYQAFFQVVVFLFRL